MAEFEAKMRELTEFRETTKDGSARVDISEGTPYKYSDVCLEVESTWT